MPALLVTVRFVEGRYHGRPEWPPSPARLFQALVAGAASGAQLDDGDMRTLKWLESLDPPILSAPPAREGTGFVSFVPNNDLDAVDGDPTRVSELRVGKAIRPRHFDADEPLFYLWTFADEVESRTLAARLCVLAERLYQLGRGIDMAHAQAAVLEDDAADCFDFRGRAHRPCPGGGELPLACPTQGSLDSLRRRHDAFRNRFRTIALPGRRNSSAQVFAQPPRALFRIVGYDSPARLLLFDIRRTDKEMSEPVFAPQKLTKTAELVAVVRNAAADRLREALPLQAPLVDAVLIGRDAREADKASRIRIIPLPSIGFVHADRAIRRILLTVPANCRLRVDDVEWAFSRVDVHDPDTGEIKGSLVSAADRKLLRRYAAEGEKSAALWRSVTPLALSVDRRRGGPGGYTRAMNEAAAAEAVRDALRHEGVDAGVLAIRVRREPFDLNGARAESFSDQRFKPSHLWHVEITFAARRRGPLVLGDGRWLGLGVMEPVFDNSGVLAFSIDDGQTAGADPILVARALRRALMARIPLLSGERKLPVFFTGHDDEEGPARSGEHRHIACVFDAARSRLLIIAPHLLERRSQRVDEEANWRRLESAMTNFVELRAGAAGLLRLSSSWVDATVDPLFAPARDWLSAARYHVLRHRKRGDARQAFTEDLNEERRRYGLPEPEILVSEVGGGRGGLAGMARLKFSHAVPGPILIGRDRHFGGGLFENRQADESADI